MGHASQQPPHQVVSADARGTFQIKAGSLFPALHRLEQNGWIDGEWDTLPNSRRIKSYRLTREGRRHLSAEKATWQRVVTAMTLMLESSS